MLFRFSKLYTIHMFVYISICTWTHGHEVFHGVFCIPLEQNVAGGFIHPQASQGLSAPYSYPKALTCGTGAASICW